MKIIGERSLDPPKMQKSFRYHCFMAGTVIGRNSGETRKSTEGASWNIPMKLSGKRTERRSEV